MRKDLEIEAFFNDIENSINDIKCICKDYNIDLIDCVDDIDEYDVDPDVYKLTLLLGEIQAIIDGR